MGVHPDDRELDRIQRRETAERLERLLAAVGGHDEASAREAYRHAHSLAGISDDREAVLAARRLANLYSDGRGHTRLPEGAEGAEAAALARQLASRLAQR